MAESLYAASRFVGWEDVVVGDPLCCPYGKSNPPISNYLLIAGHGYNPNKIGQ